MKAMKMAKWHQRGIEEMKMAAKIMAAKWRGRNISMKSAAW